MRLTDTDRDKLLLSYAAELAWRRARRGVRLNHPEAVAVISSFVLEGARDGATVAELMGVVAAEIAAALHEPIP